MKTITNDKYALVTGLLIDRDGTHLIGLRELGLEFAKHERILGVIDVPAGTTTWADWAMAEASHNNPLFVDQANLVAAAYTGGTEISDLFAATNRGELPVSASAVWRWLTADASIGLTSGAYRRDLTPTEPTADADPRSGRDWLNAAAWAVDHVDTPAATAVTDRFGSGGMMRVVLMHAARNAQP